MFSPMFSLILPLLLSVLAHESASLSSVEPMPTNESGTMLPSEPTTPSNESMTLLPINDLTTILPSESKTRSNESLPINELTTILPSESKTRSTTTATDLPKTTMEGMAPTVTIVSPNGDPVDMVLGSLVRLVCEASGVPSPEDVAFEAFPDARLTRAVEENRTTVFLIFTAAEARSKIVCSASNAFGNDSDTKIIRGLTLSVPPLIGMGPIERQIIAEHCEAVNVSCTTRGGVPEPELMLVKQRRLDGGQLGPEEELARGLQHLFVTVKAEDALITCRGSSAQGKVEDQRSILALGDSEADACD